MKKTNYTEDIFLVEAMVQGTDCQKKEAFEAFFKKYCNQIRFRLSGIVKDKEMLPDLSQDIWTKIYQNIDKYNQALGAPSTWINKIALNHTVDYIRREKRHSKTCTMSELAETTSANFDKAGNNDGGTMELQVKDPFGISPLEYVEKTQKSELLRSVLNKTSFNKEKREIFIKIVFDGHRYDSISKEHNMPIGTVKTVINRMKLEMKHHLVEIGAKNNI